MAKWLRRNLIRIVLVIALISLAIGLFGRAQLYYEHVVREIGVGESTYQAMQAGGWFALALAFGILVRRIFLVVSLAALALVIYYAFFPQVY